MILVVAGAGDAHADAVQAELARRGVEARRVDLADVPARVAVSMALGPGGAGGAALLPAGEPPIALEEVRTVWWWRAAQPRPAAEVVDPGARAFVLSESTAALEGLWCLAPVRWVNDPWRQQRADSKPLQLRVAERVGLAIPRTCITNDVPTARRFLASLGGARAIFKQLRGTTGAHAETRLVDGAVRAQLEAVALAPVILQEYVDGVTDVRVTIAGERIFATDIDARESESPTDWRFGYERARVSEGSLPGEVSAALLRLMKELGLSYGAADLRRRSDGSHVFLEVNPCGLWLFAEARTTQPITAAVADLLAEEV